jgi:hypothetical protein
MHGYTKYTLKTEELCEEALNIISFIGFNIVLIL